MKEALFEKIESLLDIERNKNYKVLDLGCGQGDFLGRLSNAMAPDSLLVGIDALAKSVESAKGRFPILEFHCEKFTDILDFEDNTFDIVVSIDTLECIPDKSALVTEISRVLSPSGKVAISHWDWDTQVYPSKNKAVVRKLVAAFSDWQQEWMDDSDGQMGRQLWGLLEGSGRFKGVISSFTLLETKYREGYYGHDRLRDLAILVESGCVDPAEYEMICSEMESLSNSGEYFYSVNSYIYTGEPA